MRDMWVYFPGQCKVSERKEKIQNILKRKGKTVFDTMNMNIHMNMKSRKLGFKA